MTATPAIPAGGPPRLLIATTNAGKVKEFCEMLSAEAAGVQWDDLTAHRDLPPARETAPTFRGNAMLKASYYSRLLGEWALADDSGLAVEALGGRPGVHSARWAEMHAAGGGDAANNRLLIEQLRELAGRGDWPTFPAKFVCALALADPAGRVVLTTTGAVSGRIIPEPRGSNGFGYDPHFYFDRLEKTTAELSPEEKHAISHRGEALRRMRALMARVSPWASPVRQ